MVWSEEDMSSEATPGQDARRLLDRLRQLAVDRLTDQKLAAGVLTALSEQESIWPMRPADSKEISTADTELTHRLLRLAGFVAGVIGGLPRMSEGPRNYKAVWYHVHATILDALDERAEDVFDRSLLAVLEVARGEISDAYGLVRGHPGQKLADECSLFFDFLDLGTDLLAAHIGCQPAAAPRAQEVHPRMRSKYSGSAERYPIDIRACVINDVRRYFPGQRIAVPERVLQAVQATYHPIGGLVPEEAALFGGLILAVPVLAFALREAEFYPEAFIDSELSFAPNDHPSWDYAWTVSLDRMFFHDDGMPSEIARRTVASREFGVFELLDGIVESMSRPSVHASREHFYRKCRDASPSYAVGKMSEAQIISTIRDRSRIARTVDPSFAWQQFGLCLDDHDTVRALAFSPWSVTRFRDWSDESQEHRLVRGNVVQWAGTLSREILDKLEWLIGQDLPESEFQHFLEQNPNVLLALGPYSRAVPHVVLHEDDGQKLIPDFFLEVADQRGADLLDLKLPSARIDLRQARRERLRAGIHEAVAQLRTYRDWFRSVAHRKQFLSKTGIKCFLPRAVIVFGRSMDFQSQIDRQRLEATLPEWARLVTYDELLGSARRWVQRGG